MAGETVAVSVMGVRVLTSVALITLLQPSVQFTLIHRSRAQGAGLSHAVDAISVPRRLVAADNSTSLQGSPRQASSAPAPTSDSTGTPTLASARTRPAANPRKTNRGENFRTSHRAGETPVRSFGKADAEGVLKRKGDGSTRLGQSGQEQTGRSTPRHTNGVSLKPSDQYPDHRASPFIEVVQVDVDSEHAQTADTPHLSPSNRKKSGPGEGANVHTAVLRGTQKAVVVVGEEEGERQSLQQAVAHRTGEPHVSKMVLTAIGSLTAILGVCIMAAIFQCCCRRKRSSSPEGGEEEKKDLDQGSSSRSNSRSSKSPSPHKVVSKDGDKRPETGLSEHDALLDEDKDLGDFSVVQRETEILRSYRKPPPPKNRARASRVPRALKGVDPKASPITLQELVDNEEKDDDTVDSPQNKATNGLLSSESMSSDMQSSMLADIDSTLAELHSNEDVSPAQSADRSREPSAEKLLAAKKSSDDSQLKSPAKPSLPTSPSKEQLAKALVQELSRSVSKEMLSKPQSRSGTPKSSEKTPKSQSAGASPKTAHSDNSSAASSKDSMGSGNSGAGGAGQSGSLGEGDNGTASNFFALIDPTAKNKSSEPGSRSKIPVRAASSPTQPTAPLRLSAGKDKRFPVPSVHGDQMDQLMKSLKTRLKDDDGATPQQTSDTVPSENSAQEDLDPQRRDRSYSDPTKQQEDRGKELQQTHL